MFTFSVGNLIWAMVNVVALLKIYLFGIGLAFSITMICDHIVDREFDPTRIVVFSLLSYVTVMMFIIETIEVLWNKYNKNIYR